MIVSILSELAHAPVRAVIINCNTRWVTTLALLSALRYAGLPVLLIDCESTDGSWDWFSELSQKYPFDLTKAPLRPHGITLDNLFRQIPADQVLLIDSDLEILSTNITTDIIREASAEGIYGAGFLHAGEWIRGGHVPASAHGFYMERMWIPFTCLNVAPVRAALEAGSTFMHSRDYLEFPRSLLVSKALYARHRLPVLKNLELKFLHRLRQHGTELSPAFREYDTGARLHEYFRQSMNLVFSDLGMDVCSASVKHYHGVTRATLSPGRNNATPPNLILNEVMQRLHDEYGIHLPEQARKDSS